MSEDGELHPIPADRQPVHGIDLGGYASLMVQLASGQPRLAVLSGAELDEPRWLEVEKSWGLRLAKSAQAGDWETLREFERKVSDAQKACPPPEPSRSIVEYAQMVAAIESGTAPLGVCAAAGLKLGEFFALQQAWTRRVVSDPELAKTFREMVVSAKQSRQGG